jgi:hypothetical protein
MRFGTITLMSFLLALPAVSGCKDKADETTSEQRDKKKSKKKSASGSAVSPASAPAVPADPWQAEIEAAKQAHAEAQKTRKTRVVRGETLEIGGEGKERAYRFKLTNEGAQAIKWAQTWVYYYDDKGKCVDRYPHSIIDQIEPGQSIERLLGESGESLDKTLKEGAKTADVEISAVEWADGTRWENENLVVVEWDRKPGGGSHEELLALEGEKVLGKWLGTHGKESKPVFKLTNITDKPLTLKTLWIYYYDDKGEVVDRDVENLDLAIPAGGTIEHEGGSAKAEIDAKVKSIEPSVSEVTIDDKEWENRNLSSSSRPMRGAKGTK